MRLDEEDHPGQDHESHEAAQCEDVEDGVHRGALPQVGASEPAEVQGQHGEWGGLQPEPGPHRGQQVWERVPMLGTRLGQGPRGWADCGWPPVGSGL